MKFYFNMAAPMSKHCCRAFLTNYAFISSRSLSRCSIVFQNIAKHSENDEPPKISKEKIVIPKKSKRDKYTVLKELSASVQKDFNAPDYKYIDDPYLIPKGSAEKRAYSLSQVSGRKAAQYVMKNYPEFFQKTPMWNFEDKLPEVYNVSMGASHADNTVEGLQERIEGKMTMAAYNSYIKLKDEGVPVPPELQQDLLELLCFYNSADPPEELQPDEQYYLSGAGQDRTRKIVKTWKDKGLAEQLFKEMDKTPEAYRALIKGMAKYYQVHGAYQLFEEMKQLNLPVDLSTYNAILGIAAFLNDGPDVRWTHQKELLQEIQDAGLQPNLATFNNILCVLLRAMNDRDCPKWMMATVNEMKRLDIEPSLGTWYHILRIIYKEKNTQSRLLYEIIDYLDSLGELTVRDPADLEFFSQAMSVATIHLQDLSLAHKIDALLNKGNNMLLVGDGYKQGIYYTQYMQLVCLTEQFDQVIELYERITPHAYTPTFTAMKEMIQSLDLNNAYSYIAKLWSDISMFYPRRSDLIEQLLQTMAKSQEELGDHSAQVVDIASNVLKKFQSEEREYGSLSGRLSGEALGNMIIIFHNAGDFDTAWNVYKAYNAGKRTIEGFPSEKSLVALAEVCIENQDTDKVLQVLNSMADFAYPKLDTLAEQVRQKLELTKKQELFVEDLLE